MTALHSSLSEETSTTAKNTVTHKYNFKISGNFSFLMNYHSWSPKTENGKSALKMTLRILDAMDNGGIHDHVGQVT